MIPAAEGRTGAQEVHQVRGAGGQPGRRMGIAGRSRMEIRRLGWLGTCGRGWWCGIELRCGALPATGKKVEREMGRGGRLGVCEFGAAARVVRGSGAREEAGGGAPGRRPEAARRVGGR
jgi:hypothetical protein